MSGLGEAGRTTGVVSGTGEPGRGEGFWGSVRPFSIKTKLGALVVISVLITTGLSMIAVHTKTELRFITVFSMIATLLITQFVAHSLTAPLDEMNTVARSISHGDYTRRVRDDRRDELGDLAQTINLMADELEAQDRQRKELVANVSHELRTPIAGLRAVLENVVDGVSAADPETMRTALQQTERLGRLVETLLDLSRLDNGVVPCASAVSRCGRTCPACSRRPTWSPRHARASPRAPAATPVPTSICTSTCPRRS